MLLRHLDAAGESSVAEFGGRKLRREFEDKTVAEKHPIRGSFAAEGLRIWNLSGGY
jgi:hypothetical protein